MSKTPAEDGRREERDSDDGGFETPDVEEFFEGNSTAEELAGDDDRPLVPEGVLHGIEDIAEGRTANADDIDAVLKD